VREVFDADAGHLLERVSEPVLLRAFDYWRNIDQEIGRRVAAGGRAAR
jgi:catalase